MAHEGGNSSGSQDRVVFVSRGKGTDWMAREGFAPDPFLLRVPLDGRTLADGFDVSADLIDEVRLGLSRCGAACRVAERLPERASLATIEKMTEGEARLFARSVGSFLDALGTSLGRETFYNTKAEQERAEARIHDEMFRASRGLYAVLGTLPGVTEHARMAVAGRLLSRSPSEADETAGEGAVIAELLREISPPRRFRLFERLRNERVNNARVRKSILRSVLANPKLEFHCVKYRTKLRSALEHALGRKRASILAKVAAKPETERTEEETASLRKEIGRFAGRQARLAADCLAFLFGHRVAHRPLLGAYHAAREDLKAGHGLPPEVLEGIRSVYHPRERPAKALEIGAEALTKGQKIGMQRRAEKEGVEVSFDPSRYDPVRLYLYAYERGMTPEIEEALDEKARTMGSLLGFHYGHVGVLLDGSGSMAGRETQRLRPIATALAIRDALAASATRRKATVQMAGGRVEGRLVRPEGDSSLALALVKLLRERPDVVFVVTDGYENAPAGRVEEVVEKLREIGVRTPIFQVSPVFAAESSGIRRLGPGLVPALPVMNPEGLGLGLLRARLETEPVGALADLWRRYLPEPGAEGGESES